MSSNPFSYENPVVQMLITVGDLIILNFLFILCSLPIFTMGAAQAGMYTAMRVMRDKEDDSSVVAAYFRGFKSGFGKITVTWLAATLIIVGMVVFCAYANGLGLPAWICIVPVVVLAWFAAQLPAIHSRFDCTPLQLVRNSWFLVIAHPLRTLGVAVLTLLPLLVFLMDAFKFLTFVPLWCVIYFSLAYLFGQTFLAKPFATMVEEFNNRQNAAEAEEI